jgi:hypothetical protein
MHVHVCRQRGKEERGKKGDRRIAIEERGEGQRRGRKEREGAPPGP